jgi:small subunit ribosomal protein S7
MPRRARVVRRPTPPDPKYGNVTLQKFINKVMERGKKSLAERIVYTALDHIEKRAGRSAIEVFERAVQNATPLLEVRPRRVGGATYQVPMEIPAHRRLSLAIRWLIQSARRRHGPTMAVKLAEELIDASQGQGATIRRREETHRMAEANKAFSHYRW